MSKLVLIDGSSYLYRAFHALPPLSNAAGEPTGALFGVVNMLRATLAARPDHVAFVLDAAGPTFREAIDPAYKANRPPMPEDLRAQVEPMLAIVQALGLPTLRVPGVEADDVIGTLAARAAAAGMDVEISTSDKDFAQLVGPRVTLVNSMDRTRLDHAGVLEKFGVAPERIVDYLALMGDKVDNIRGVDKCGPKTAAKWLADYGDLDGVMAHADAVPGKLGENLRAALAWLPRSRDLATIRTALELDVAPGQLAPRARDVEALRALYQRYGFNSALAALERGDAESAPRPATRLPAPAPPVSPEAAPDPSLAAPGVYTQITTQTQLDAWLEQLRGAPLIAFDTETTSLDAIDAEIVGVSFAV
ncbi:MAG: DNA polymerase I, partial [Pseudomonadota bacterium]|nr:DNA polymerase I [Pseudomonadota bacterium]